jgi:hypothetical protein
MHTLHDIAAATKGSQHGSAPGPQELLAAAAIAAIRFAM